VLRRVDDAADRLPAIIPYGIGVRRHDGHVRIGLEQQHRAVAQRKVDARVFQAQGLRDPLQRAHGAWTQDSRHIGEKLRLLGPVFGISRHAGREIVHLPVGRDGEMQRIQLPIDHHHAVLSRHPIGAAGIEILDRENLLARQCSRGGGELSGLLDAHEVLSGMESGRPQQQRKLQVCAVYCIPLESLNDRRDHVRKLPKTRGILRAARHQHP